VPEAVVPDLEGREDAAEGIAKLEDGLWCGAHEYARRPRPTCGGSTGDSTKRRPRGLTKAGYRHLGDVVDVTSAKASRWARAVIRVMLSGDGRVTAGIYHVKLSGFPRLLQLVGVLSRNMLCVSLETELDDGTFVTTTNDRESNLTGEFPGIARLQLTAATPVGDMVAEHAQNLRHALSCKPTGLATVIQDDRRGPRVAEPVGGAQERAPTLAGIRSRGRDGADHGAGAGRGRAGVGARGAAPAAAPAESDEVDPEQGG
jgi:hypothetical protein